MKKLIITLLLSIIIIPSMIVNAKSESFYEGEYIPGAYMKKFKGDTGKYQQMRVFRRTSDNHVAYCIELWQGLINGHETAEYSDNYAERTGMRQDQWIWIQLLAYYGYGYQNHTDISWYAATQYLIWQTIELDSTFYFTDTLNGNQADKFITEINEINNLVFKHYTKPSFHNNTYNINLGSSIDIIDTNNVLDKYTISNNEAINFEKNNNILRIKGVSPGKTTLNLTKINIEEVSKIYVDPTSQDLLVRGRHAGVPAKININILGGNIKITKKDSETKTKIPQGEASLVGAIYNVYDEKGTIVAEIPIKEGSEGLSPDLPYGKYSIEEKKAGSGYQLDLHTYHTLIDETTPSINLELYNTVIKKSIEIHKYYEGENTIRSPEANAKFGFYNSNNEKIGEVITDEFGIGVITLPYGNYTIKQENGKANYKYIEDLNIKIDENNPDNIPIYLVNQEQGYPLKIIKTDSESNLPIILSKAKFKIKNLDTGKYLSTLDNLDTFSTDKTGKLLLPFNIMRGRYLIEEVVAPNGYYPNNYLLDINDDTETKYDDDLGNIIELKLSNQKIKGSLEIIKKGEAPIIENNQLNYHEILIKGMKLNIYAKNDIITGDGTIHYYKDQLVKTVITDINGYVKLDSLVLGNYYVIEDNNLDEYIVNNHKYVVELSRANTSSKLKLFNHIKKSNIEITNLDTNNQVITNSKFEVINNLGNIVGIITTDCDGKGYLYDLPLGTYKIKQLKVSKPYILNLDTEKVSLINYNDNSSITVFNDKPNTSDLVPNTSVNSISPTNNIYLILLLTSIFIVLTKKALKLY